MLTGQETNEAKEMKLQNLMGFLRTVDVYVVFQYATIWNQSDRFSLS